MYQHAVRPFTEEVVEKRAVKTPESRRIKGYKMLCRATTCDEFGCVWFERARAAATYDSSGVNLVRGHGAKHPLGIHGELRLEQEAEICVCERLF